MPIRVPVHPGECLDSWVEALARRYGITPRTLLPALGLPVYRYLDTLTRQLPGELLREAEQRAGLAPGRLDDTVLDPYVAAGLAAVPEQRFPVGRWARWARASGARYCPRCLAETAGRWSRSWYLSWSFVCTRHRMFLAAACPRCGMTPRRGDSRLDEIPDARLCWHTAPGPDRRPHRGPRCRADLTTSRPLSLPTDHPVLQAQKWVNRVLIAPAERATTHPVRFAGIEIGHTRALDELGAVMVTIGANAEPVRRVSRHLAPGIAVDAGIARTARRALADSVPGRLSRTDNDTIAFGIAVTAALDALLSPSLDSAGDALSDVFRSVRRQLPRDYRREADDPTRIVDHLIDAEGHRPSLLQAITIRHHGPAMRISDQLAYRTANPIPRPPLHPGNQDRRDGTVLSDADPQRWYFWGARTPDLWPRVAGQLPSIPPRLLPQCIWPSVATDWPRHTIKETVAFPAAMAMALSRVGSAESWPSIAWQLELPAQLARTVSAVWRALDRRGHTAFLVAALDALAETLAANPPPIDYGRRRLLFRDLQSVDREPFDAACRAHDLRPTRRRRRFATMLIWETLTGGDARLNPASLRPTNPGDHSAYREFVHTEGVLLKSYLVSDCELHLAAHSINEPIWWQPTSQPPRRWPPDSLPPADSVPAESPDAPTTTTLSPGTLSSSAWARIANSNSTFTPRHYDPYRIVCLIDTCVAGSESGAGARQLLEYGETFVRHLNEDFGVELIRFEDDRMSATAAGRQLLKSYVHTMGDVVSPSQPSSFRWHKMQHELAPWDKIASFLPRGRSDMRASSQPTRVMAATSDAPLDVGAAVHNVVDRFGS